MKIGHVMLDLVGLELSQQEKEMLQHPQVGGIILFSRNYESKKQLRALTKEIRKYSNCLIAVDQEGGRVQRFREDFLPLPAFKAYGELFEKDQAAGIEYAEKMAFSMATELKEVGINLSFSPVLDLDRGHSEVIGDRSFHCSAETVITLGRAFIRGMRRAGMPATGKHFPGHGAVAADSHKTLPIDSRQFEEIEKEDMIPFLALNDELDAVMPAHILYDKVDSYPTCFSSYWLQDILRSKVQFSGLIFSDDLSMAGAEYFKEYDQRAIKALEAGCDMVLICNNQVEAINTLAKLEKYENPISGQRLIIFSKKSSNREQNDGELRDPNTSRYTVSL